MNMTDELEQGAELLRALAHPLRLAILRALVAGERPVAGIEAQSAITQPALSQQLAILRQAGLVRTRRAARQVFYRTDGAALEQATRLLTSLSSPAPPAAVAAAARRPARGEGAAMFAQVSRPEQQGRAVRTGDG